MLLIEIFSDYVFNKKSLKEYVEVRKSINERGEFNDNALIQAEENLQKLKTEDKKVYDLMYETLDKYVEADRGITVEYPINFIREVLKLSKKNASAHRVYESYKAGLNHHLLDD